MASADTCPCSGRLRRVLCQQWSLLAVFVTMGFAFLEPKPGADIYNLLHDELIVVLFVVLGLTLDLDQLSQGVAAIHIHVACQVYSLFAMPLIYYAAVFRWGWEERLGILIGPFRAGVMVAMCMPTTAQTCVLFTQQAGGDVPVAAVNAAVGNVLGGAVAPFVAQHLLGEYAGGGQGLACLRLACLILVPLTSSLLLQGVLRRHAPRVHPRVVAFSKSAMTALMVVFFYFIWCIGFTSKSNGLALGDVGRMILWVLLVHIFFLLGAWLLGSRASTSRHIALIFAAPQKTEGMAIAILGVIFKDVADIGLISLPVVVYHSVQMVVAAMLIGPLRRRSELESS